MDDRQPRSSEYKYEEEEEEDDDDDDHDNDPPSYEYVDGMFNVGFEPTLDEMDEDGRIDGRMGGRMDGRMDGRIDGSLDGENNPPYRRTSINTHTQQDTITADNNNNNIVCLKGDDGAGGVKEDGGCCGRCCACLKRTKSELKSTFRDVGGFCRKKCRPRYYGKPKKCCWHVSKKIFPCLRWIPKYSLLDLRGDLIAGLTTGISVLLQGLAYAAIVEVSPLSHGLYSSIMGSYVYAVLGGINQVAVGPSCVVAILTAQYATSQSPLPHDHTYPTILAFITGLILLFFGLTRLGFLFKFISMPVLKAFRCAAAITIFISRIKKWWGQTGVPRDFLPQLYWTLRKIPEINWIDFGLGILSMILLFTFKKLKARKWPKKQKTYQKVLRIFFWILGAERNIITVTIGGFIVHALLSNNYPVSHLPPQPSGVPFPSVPSFTLTVPPAPNSTHNNTIHKTFLDIAADIGPGFFFIPSVIMFECISTGSTFARKFNYKYDYNTELVAIGVSNILTASLGGYPITGALLRSGININAGVRTPAGGIVAATVVILGTTYISRLFYFIPISALAACILLGSLDICSFHKLGLIWFINKREVIPWLVTFVISLTMGIEYGVPFGVAVHSIILLFNQIYPAINRKVVKRIDGEESEVRVEMSFKRPHPSISFLSSSKIRNYYLEKVDWNDEELKEISFDLKGVNNMDTTIIYNFKQLDEICCRRNIVFKLTNTMPSLVEELERAGLQYELDNVGDMNGNVRDGKVEDCQKPLRRGPTF